MQNHGTITRTADIVTAVRKETLAAYHANPRLVREHANSERVDQQTYAGRPLLEALQNVEDALAVATEQQRAECACLIELRDDELILANHGAPFSKAGFEALCARSDSPKAGNRFVGSKGTGFKALLNWSERPEIYSGDIFARYDPDEAKRLVVQQLGEDAFTALGDEDHRGWRRDVATLRLPLNAQPNRHVKSLLADGWCTVIRLPLRDGFSEAVREAWNEVDRHALIFLRHLKRLELRDGQSKEILTIDRDRDEGDGSWSVRLSDTRGTKHYRLFRIEVCESPRNQTEVGLAEVGAAFEESFAEMEHWPTLYSHFPVRTVVGPFAGVLVHGSFLLNAARDDLREDDTAYHDALIEALDGLLVERVVPRLVSFHGADAPLALRPARPDESSAEIHSESLRLRQRLVDRAVGYPCARDLWDTLRAPCELRLWVHGIRLLARSPEAILDDGYPASESSQAGARRVALAALGASELMPVQHLAALQGIEPASQREAMELAGTVAWAVEESSRTSPSYFTSGGILEEARSIRCWWTDLGKALSLDDRQRVFETLPSGLPRPAWLQVATLDPAYRDALEGTDNSKVHALWNRLRSVRKDHLHSYSARLFLNEVLVPSLHDADKSWWEENGGDAVDVLLHVGCESDNEMVLADEEREKAAEVVLLPRRDGGWESAGRLYAPNAWGSEVGETLAEAIPGRYVVDSSHTCLKDREMKRLCPALRYVGVSWDPKFVKWSPCAGNWVYRPSALAESATPHGVPQDQWQDYCRSELAPHITMANVGSVRIPQQLGVEGLDILGPHLQQNAVSHARILGMLLRLKGGDSDGRMERRGPRGGMSAAQKTRSFVTWQLKTTRLFPTNQSPLSDGLETADRLFVFDTEPRSWQRWLPRLHLGDCASEERHKLAAHALERLDLLSDVRAAPAGRWRDWLDRVRGRFPEGTLLERTKELYALAHDLSKVEALEELADESLPCESSCGLTYAKPGEFLVLDLERWRPLKSALLSNGYRILLAELKAGETIARTLGVEECCLADRLSTSIDDIGPPTEQSTYHLDLGLRARVLALIEATEQFDVENWQDERFEQLWPADVLLVPRLSVAVELDGIQLEVVNLTSHAKPGRVYVHMDHAPDGIAEALVNGLGPKGRAIHDALARLIDDWERSHDHADNFLRHKQITHEAVEAWLVRLSPPSAPEESTEEAHPLGSGHATAPEAAQLEAIPSQPTPSAAIEDDHEGTSSEPGPLASQQVGSGRSSESGQDRSENSDQREPRSPPPSRFGHGSTAHGARQREEARSTRTSQEARESGERAEEWVRKKLKETLADEWLVSDKPERDERGRETDIVLRAPGGVAVHIEVKSLSGGAIFWSQLEASKAGTLGNAYCMVVLRERESILEDEDPYQCAWIADPLRVLANWPRLGFWRWSGEGPTVAYQPSDAWLPPNKPDPGMADRLRPSFVYRVDLRFDELSSYAETLDEMRRHWSCLCTNYTIPTTWEE